ncbi:B12-binding domain-containing radical SAM protein [Desulfosudis oleivorans]|uniref:Radical SAM domain protein n=1 Tax=Desulfosudis oleivorans (strain DSM 6200 / JCM 39069 / Hxd3) TaxID=96561 RepID=A8ZWN8_DESOH|nr:B12-binding domain-containing radical SAM protein [Desulfosudis oleivorans]ABW68369.1 Radical SAM domain protein [Desulfosudis oleivorans Hxd3]
MNVLLISANTETINMPVLPLGLSCIARAVRAAGHQAMVVNTLDKDRLIPEALQAIETFHPRVIGISVRNIDDQTMEPARFLLEPVRDLIAACKKQTSAPIVLGGAGYSIFPEAALSYLGADRGIRGPGEKPFVSLLAHLENNKSPAAIPGLYLPGRKPAAPLDPDCHINDYPMPLPEDQVFAPSETGDAPVWVPFQTRRGCPMDCSYCSTASIEGRTTRKRDLSRVIDTLAAYRQAGFSHLFFVDNTFNIPPSYAKALCDGIIEKNLNLSWRCIVYPWKIDNDLAEKMASAGCKEVSLGFESGSAQMLRAFNKKFTPDDVRAVSAALKQFNIKQTGFLLLGGPGETEQTIQESLAFVESLNLDATKITSGIRIYPETQLARQAVAQGIIAPDDTLLFPRFYMAPAVKDTIRAIVAPWLTKHPNWFS